MTFSLRHGALVALALILSCEKTDLELAGPEAVAAATVAEMSKSYNNGMVHAYSSAVVMAWNGAIQVVENKMPPPAEARIYTLVSLAMHDALNSIVPRYLAYAQDNSGVDASGVSKDNIGPLADAAVSQAAYEVLTTLFPGAQTAADALLASSLAAIADPDLKAQGISIGHAAAVALFARRQGDVPLLFTTFNLGDAPGVFQTNYMPWLVANSPLPTQTFFNSS